MGLVAVVRGTLVANRELAAHAVHGEGLVVLTANGLSKLRCATWLGKGVLSQRSTCRVAQLAAAVAVANFTLLTDDRSYLRWFRFAHLATEGFPLAEPIDDGLHGAIQWEISGAKLVEEHDFTTNGTGE